MSGEVGEKGSFSELRWRCLEKETKNEDEKEKEVGGKGVGDSG